MSKGRRSKKDAMNDIIEILTAEDKRKFNAFRRLPNKDKQDHLRLLKTKKYKTRYDRILLNYV